MTVPVAHKAAHAGRPLVPGRRPIVIEPVAEMTSPVTGLGQTGLAALFTAVGRLTCEASPRRPFRNMVGHAKDVCLRTMARLGGVTPFGVVPATETIRAEVGGVRPASLTPARVLVALTVGLLRPTSLAGEELLLAVPVMQTAAVDTLVRDGTHMGAARRGCPLSPVAGHGKASR